MDRSVRQPGMGRLALAHESWHRAAYARLGSRYPRLDVLGVLAFMPVVSLGAVAATALYVPLESGQFLRLLVASQILFGVVAVIAWHGARKQLVPLERWLAREPGADAAEAWRAAVRAPFAIPHARAVLVGAAVTSAIWDAYAVAELDLPWPAALVLFAGSVIAFIYWMMFAFLSLEHGLRPVADDICRQLPPGEAVTPQRVPLRLRLGTALPAINVITGVVVAGAFPGKGGVHDLAIGIGVALAVSGSVSLVVTNLLTDSVVTPIATLREAADQVGRGDLDVHVGVTTGDEMGDLARSFNDMVGGLRQRERLRSAFGAFVDPQLAERVEQETVDLAGDEVDASVLFLDVRGFTGYAEQASAHDVVARLNDLFECVVPVILEHGGHANKFIGDGLLAVFGAPDRLVDHADRAVDAALGIREAVSRRFEGRLRVGIGVNSGSVVVGTIGGGGRLDFTVIGDPVNTAARVESATRETGDDVLVTGATRQRLTVERGWLERPGIALKGKTETVRLYAPAITG